MEGRREDRFTDLGPAGQRQLLGVYGWLLGVTLGLLLLVLTTRGLSASDVQHQRYHSIVVNCQKENREHHELFAFSKEERERVVNERLAGKFLIREGKVLARIERRDGILKPWQDCVALANSRVH